MENTLNSITILRIFLYVVIGISVFLSGATEYSYFLPHFRLVTSTDWLAVPMSIAPPVAIEILCQTFIVLTAFLFRAKKSVSAFVALLFLVVFYGCSFVFSAKGVENVNMSTIEKPQFTQPQITVSTSAPVFNSTENLEDRLMQIEKERSRCNCPSWTKFQNEKNKEAALIRAEINKVQKKNEVLAKEHSKVVQSQNSIAQKQIAAAEKAFEAQKESYENDSTLYKLEGYIISALLIFFSVAGGVGLSLAKSAIPNVARPAATKAVIKQAIIDGFDNGTYSITAASNQIVDDLLLKFGEGIAPQTLLNYVNEAKRQVKATEPPATEIVGMEITEEGAMKTIAKLKKMNLSKKYIKAQLPEKFWHLLD